MQEAGWSQRRPYEWGFAVVRHPVDRWFSGVHQYTVNNHVPHEALFDEARNGRFVFDQHTRRQVDFLPLEETVVVRLEDAPGFVEPFGLNMGHLRKRDIRVAAPDLIPAILAFYEADLALYEVA